MHRRTMFIAWCVLGLAVIGMVVAWGRLHSASSLHAPSIVQQLRPQKLRGPVPAFSATTLNGETVSHAELTGKPTVLDFFASWCAPCKAEAAGLGRLAKSYGNRVRFIGVDIDDTSKSASRAFLQKNGWTFPVIWDPNDTLVNRFGIAGKPTMILIDRSGGLALKVPGQHPIAQYRAAIDRLEAG